MKNRIEMIKAAHRKIYGAPLPGLIPVSKREIVGLARSMRGGAVEEEEGEFKSRLEFDKAEVRAERETDILLTARERAQVKVVARKQVVEVENEVFPPQDVPNYEPTYTPEIDTYARAVASFELDIESQPLRLLG